MPRETLASVVYRDVIKQLSFQNDNDKSVSDDDDSKEAQTVSEVAAVGNKCLFALLTADFVLGQLLIGPLVTTCWRSAWLSFDFLLDSCCLSPIWLNHTGVATCVALGLVILNALPSLAPIFERMAGDKEDGGGNTVRFHLASRTFTLFSFFSSIVLWKGWWDACEMVGADLAPLAVVGGVAGLAALGRSRTNIGAPLAIHVEDRRTETSYFYLRERHVGEALQLRPFFTSCAVASTAELLAVSCWFGVWTLENRLSAWLKLDAQWQSAIFSMVIGLTAATLAFFLQFVIMHSLQDVPSYFLSAAHAIGNNLLAVIGLLSTVSNLRCVWYLLDAFINPEYFLLSLLLSFWFAFSVLACLGCASTLHGGVTPDPEVVVSVDGVGERRCGFLMPGFYLTYFAIKSRRASKLDGHRQYIAAEQEDG